MRYFVEICIICGQLSTCTTYLKYFGEQINEVICSQSNGLNCDNKNMCIFIGVMFLIMLTGVRNYKQLSLISMIANIAVILAIACICFDGLYKIFFRQSSAVATQITYLSIYHFPSYFSRLSISMEGSPLFPGIYASTGERKQYPKILNLAITLVGVLTVTICILSYFSYG